MKHASLSRRRDYDILRVASMAAVVYLHTAPWHLRQQEDMALWHFSNIVAALCNVAVPVFFMLSGALVLNSEKTESPVYVLRRRLPHVLVPFLAWSFLTLGFLWRREGFQAALDKFLTMGYTTVLVPYWFLYALVPMYLLSPFLRLLVDGMKEVHWKYFAVLWVGVTLTLGSLRGFVPAPWNSLITENLTMGVSLLEGYLGYFLVGAWLERYRPALPRKVLWSVFLADWAVICLGTWWDLAHGRGYSGRFLSYLGVFTMILAVSVFLLAESYWREGRGSGPLLKLLAASSFGVYLAHPYGIKVAERLVSLGGIPGQLLTWLVALLGSLAGVILVASIKPLCFLVTGQKFSSACKESNLFAMLRNRKKND